MPSKRSKPSPRRASSPWKSAPGCDESRVRDLARELAASLHPGDWVLLDGPMGAGKSAFARHALEALGVVQRLEGSPTFAIAHEYVGRSDREVAHLDLYRMRSEEELEEAGVLAVFWGRPGCIVLCEWTAMWPGLRGALVSGRGRQGRRVWTVSISFAAGEGLRDLEIQLL